MTTTNHDKHTITKQEIDQGKGMAILSYFGFLALIPYFAEKKNKFVRFHAVQGMNLFLIAVAYGIISGIVQGIVTSVTVSSCVNSIFSLSVSGCNYVAVILCGWVFGLIGLGLGIICIIGIVYAASGQTKEVPILGKIKIIKK